MFYKLDKAKLEKIEDGTCLDTLLLEKEMHKYNGGIDLSDLKARDIIPNEEQCLNFIPYFAIFERARKKENVLNVVNKYEDQKEPCAMIVNSIDELAEHMSNAYQASHFHYMLGKMYNIGEDGNDFPKEACGTSSLNLVIALIEHGYKNATLAINSELDHGYVVLPFVLREDGKETKGSIVVDPTSDQLGMERNAVFIKLGSEWEYKTEWERCPGEDLFPNKLAPIDVLRKSSYCVADTKYYHRNPKESFEKAFSHPVEVKIKEK